jgi:hypothetical protein
MLGAQTFKQAVRILAIAVGFFGVYWLTLHLKPLMDAASSGSGTAPHDSSNTNLVGKAVTVFPGLGAIYLGIRAIFHEIVEAVRKFCSAVAMAVWAYVGVGLDWLHAHALTDRIATSQWTAGIAFPCALAGVVTYFFLSRRLLKYAEYLEPGVLASARSRLPRALNASFAGSFWVSGSTALHAAVKSMGGTAGWSWIAKLAVLAAPGIVSIWLYWTGQRLERRVLDSGGAAPEATIGSTV